MDSPDRLRRILDLVEDSLDEPDLTGVDLAARAYLSRFHFDRLVRASVGESPGAFRRRLLLERAAHRLGSTGELVIDVAVDAGYGSAEAFARAFSRAFGTAPSQFRRDPRRSHDLPSTNGIHFHPPGGLRLPADTRSSGMDVLTRMFDHHIWLAGQIIDHSAGLGDDDLDRQISLSVEGIDDSPTCVAWPTASSASWRCGSARSTAEPRCRHRATRRPRGSPPGSPKPGPASGNSS